MKKILPPDSRLKKKRKPDLGILDVLNVIFIASDTPSSRRANFFGNRYAKVAAQERIDQTGYTETMRVLELYLHGVQTKEPYRPAFKTATQLLTVGWPKVVAYTDKMAKTKGKIIITDQAVKDEIIAGLKSGGSKK